MSKRGVFTAIPYIPGETKAERYEGMPLSAEESVFSLSHLLERYDWNIVEGFLIDLDRFENAPKQNNRQTGITQRKGAVDTINTKLTNEPSQIPTFFGFFNALRDQISSEIKDLPKKSIHKLNTQGFIDTVRDFELEVLKVVRERNTLNGEITPALAVELFDLAFAFRGKQSGHAVEKFLGEILDKQLDTGIVVPTIYSIAVNALKSGDNNKIAYLSEMLVGATKVGGVASDIWCAMYAGMFYYNNDTAKMMNMSQMTSELVDVVTYLARYYVTASSFANWEEYHTSYYTSEIYRKSYKNLLDMDPRRHEKILNLAIQLGNVGSTEHILFSGPEDFSLDDLSIIGLRQGELGLLHSELLAQHTPERHDLHYIPGFGALLFSKRGDFTNGKTFHKDMGALLKRSVGIPGSEVFTPENSMKYLTTLAKYNRPEQISAVEVENITRLNQGYKDGMFLGLQPKKERVIPKKGVKINITDPDLKEFGYKSMTFKPGDNGYTYCQFKVGEYAFVFYIDDKGNMQDLPACDDVSKKIMETMVLAHLDEFMCVTKESLRPGMSKAEFKDFENQFKRTITARRRRLTSKRPRIPQMELAAADKDWAHLIEENRIRIIRAISDIVPKAAELDLAELLTLVKQYGRLDGLELYTYVIEHEVRYPTPDTGDPLRFTSHVTQKDIYGSE